MLTANCSMIICNILACQPERQRNTMVRIGVVASALVVVCSLKAFTAKRWKIKPLFFVALGLILMEPMLSWAWRGRSGGVAEDADIKHQVIRAFAVGWSLMVLTVGLFVARVPERRFPGRFDLLFHSHNLLHILTVGGSICVWVAGRAAGRSQWCEHEAAFRAAMPPPPFLARALVSTLVFIPRVSNRRAT